MGARCPIDTSGRHDVSVFRGVAGFVRSPSPHGPTALRTLNTTTQQEPRC
jgi:hypothetical protein